MKLEYQSWIRIRLCADPNPEGLYIVKYSPDPNQGWKISHKENRKKYKINDPVYFLKLCISNTFIQILYIVQCTVLSMQKGQLFRASSGTVP